HDPHVARQPTDPSGEPPSNHRCRAGTTDRASGNPHPSWFDAWRARNEKDPCGWPVEPSQRGATARTDDTEVSHGLPRASGTCNYRPPDTSTGRGGAFWRE